MSLASKSAAVFLLDCSASMNDVVAFKDGIDKHATSRHRTSLEVMKEYVKAKIVQRIMRNLKTIPVAVLAFGFPKTKNIMTTRAKTVAMENGESFDRQSDAYRGIYELVPITFSPGQDTLADIDRAVAGQGHDGDAHTALIAAIETLEAQPSISKYQTKEIFVLTDGESSIDWDEWKGTVKGLKERGISVKVVGVNFDDEYLEYVEEDKSETKRENEKMFRKMTAKLQNDERTSDSVVANAVAAIAAVTTPVPRSTSSRADKMTLKLGDPEEHPDRSIVMYVDVKKAVVPAPIPSMKKMSLAGFDRRQQSQEASQKRTKRSHDHVDAEEQSREETPPKGKIASREEAAEGFNKKQRGSLIHPDRGPSSSLSLGKIGTDLETTLRLAGLQEPDDEDADLASHGVKPEHRSFYRPVVDPKSSSTTVKVKQKPILGGESDEEEFTDGPGGGTEGHEDEERKEVGEDSDVVDAYYYGGDLIPFGDFDATFGKLAGLTTGMEVISFMKMADVRYDWRMGDVFYVYASVGQSGSEKLFSAFINGMEERAACAVVRFVKKGFMSTKAQTHIMPDPQVGILFPATDRETKSEFCYYIRLPFGEDIRSPGFPSLTHLFNRKGEPITAHSLLPTKAQDQAMEEFVDSMNLDNIAEYDDEGEKVPWFNIYESFSPAIHNIQNTLMFRLTNPEGDLPPIPSSLTRYLDPPRALVESSNEAKEAAVDAFKVLVVPPKPKKLTKANENYVQPDDEKAAAAYAALLGDGADAKRSSTSRASRNSQASVTAKRSELENSPRQSQPESESRTVSHSQPSAQSKPTMTEIDMEDMQDDEEPATEESDDDEDVTVGTKPGASTFAGAGHPSSDAHSVPQLVEEARRLVETSFSSQNFDKATARLEAARKAAIRLNDPAAYNSAVRTFASKLHAHKHRDYLGRIATEDLGLLIGDGTVENDAEDFLEALS